MQLFGMGIENESFYDNMEDVFIEADMGARFSLEIIEEVKRKAKENRLKSKEDLLALIVQVISAALLSARLEPNDSGLNCFLFLGVNGVGKTTSIAKYAHWLKSRGWGDKTVLAAGDTFRAAASEQLVLHGTRLGIRTVSQGSGADPAAVIFDALESALARQDKVVLADTAGRLHNKVHLVKELEKIDKIVRAKIGPQGNYKKILVIDATTGQNGLQQAQVFHEAVGVDGVILTKFDSTAKGGIVLSICRNVGLPIMFLGHGETYADLSPFDADEFARNLIDRELS